MRVIETAVYTFKELSKKAQVKAIAGLANINVDHNWWDFTYEYAANIGLKLTGFDLNYGRNVEGEFTGDARETARLIFDTHGKDCRTYATAKKFVVKMAPYILKYGDAMDTGDLFYGEEEEIQDIYDQFKKSLLNDYGHILQEEYDYRISDEAIKESIEANEYEFEEDGTLI